MAVRKNKVIKLSDITLPKDYKIRRDGISQSLLSIFPLCRLRFLLKINRWKKPGSDIFVSFGNIVHDVLEWVYAKGKIPSKAKIKRLVNKSFKKWEKIVSIQSLRDLPQVADQAEVVMIEYFKFYKNDFKKMKFEEVERVFHTKIHGYPTKGKKDGLFTKYFKNAKKRKRVLMEHKTKSRVKEDLLETVLNFDFQNLFYVTADEIDSGKPLFDVLYNIIRNPGLRQKSGEDYKEFLNRIKEDIQARPEFYFIRYEIEYQVQDKEIFKQELKYKLNEVEAFLRGKLPVYRNQLACEIPYRCEYLQACGSGNLNGYEQGSTLFPEL